MQSQFGLPEVYSEDQVKRAKNAVVLPFLPRKSQARQHRDTRFQNPPPNLLPVIIVSGPPLPGSHLWAKM